MSNQKTLKSFEDLDESVVVRKEKETCPSCGNRARWSNHPLCSHCNEAYLQESAEKVLAENGSVTGRLDWAKSQGVKTLERLKEKLRAAKKEEQDAQQPYWNRAHEAVREKLKEGGYSQVDRSVFNRAKGLEFGRIWNSNKKNVKLSKRVRGISKAIESLVFFLEELDKKLSS